MAPLTCGNFKEGAQKILLADAWSTPYFWLLEIHFIFITLVSDRFSKKVFIKKIEERSLYSIFRQDSKYQTYYQIHSSNSFKTNDEGASDI